MYIMYLKFGWRERGKGEKVQIRAGSAAIKNKSKVSMAPIVLVIGGCGYTETSARYFYDFYLNISNERCQIWWMSLFSSLWKNDIAP